MVRTQAGATCAAARKTSAQGACKTIRAYGGMAADRAQTVIGENAMKTTSLISRRRAAFGRRGFRALALRRRATMARSLRPLILPALFALLALCAQAQAQNATGVLRLVSLGTELTGAPPEDSTVTLRALDIEDPDGVDNLGSTISWQWSHDNQGDGNFAIIEDNTDATWTPRQEHVGSRIRVCAMFDDDDGNRENLCLTTEPVANTNDAPVVVDSRISVSVGANESAPYKFRPQDFTFDDDDDDSLAAIMVRNLPIDSLGMSAGTLTLSGNALTSATVPTTVTAAQLEAGALAYWPASGQQPSPVDDLEVVYGRFGFLVTDDGDGPGGDPAADKTSARSGFARIRLAQAEQAAAAGGPQVSVPNVVLASVYAEGSELRARIHGIAEPNGIDESTLTWQWQQSASASGGFANIAGATAAAFVLTQAQARAGRHIRACAAFMDHHATPRREGPLCGASVRINAAPRALPSTVLVSTSTTAAAPYAFKASDFRFADADGGALASITITGAPNKGTLLIDGDALVTSGSGQNNVVDVSDIPTLTYYQDADGTEPAQNYASFRFTVSDGIESSAAATMRIDLGDSLRLRLRVFLEGPLR